MVDKQQVTVAVIGGTGNLGRALARRWAVVGYTVIIGSRSAEKGSHAAREIAQAAVGANLSSATNLAAAQTADIIVLTVPFTHHQAILEMIRTAVQGKILVDTTVPLVPPRVARVQLPEEGSIAKATQEYLGNNVRVVSAFKTVAASRLHSDATYINLDVLVCGNNPDARQSVIELVESAGLRGWHAGAIDNSAASEALASVLIFLNMKYKLRGAGLRILGEEQED
jgi:NADPH-dependent F420 reductase